MIAMGGRTVTARPKTVLVPAYDALIILALANISIKFIFVVRALPELCWSYLFALIVMVTVAPCAVLDCDFRSG